MKIGTKSLLFGVHQVFIHPVCVALAWRALYGITWDPRIWVAFVVHDWGYWGLDELDGPKGDLHPERGAKIMHYFFDSKGFSPDLGVVYCQEVTWYEFCLYHSRFLAKKMGSKPSRLCMADKLATNYYPVWLFVFLSTITGEIKLFMNKASIEKHNAMGLDYTSKWRFVRTMQEYLHGYAFAHKDGQEDKVTNANKPNSP